MGFGPLPLDDAWIHTLNRPQIAVLSVLKEYQHAPPDVKPFGQTSVSIDNIRVEGVGYSLREAAQGEFYPNPVGGGAGTFVVAGFPWIEGHGKTLTAAKRDWLEQFHIGFQRLYVLRPFEMDEADAEQWERIRRLVDVEKYRASQPITVLQRGKVVHARPTPVLVEWNDGTREKIKLVKVPPEFAGYRAGQVFEAVVHRDPGSQKMTKIEYLKRIPSRDMPTAAEAEEAWNSLSTSARLPETTWD